GHGHKRRLQRLQGRHGAEQFLRRRVGLRWEELEAERRRVFGEDVLDVHGGGSENGSTQLPEGGYLVLPEKAADRSAETGQVRLAGQLLVLVEKLRAGARAVDGYRPIVRVEHPNEANADREVFVDLLIDFL